MFELTINDVVYSFNFGIGFVREIDKKKQIKGEDGAFHDAGLQFAVASLIDNDPIELVNILDLGNKGQNPRVSRKDLDAYIDDESTDIDALFTDLLDFFGNANATKKKTEAVLKLVADEKAKAERAETSKS